jgi:orotate phosphoribosyltransferase
MALAADISAASFLTGTFVLRSGVISETYFDKYRFESDPALLRRIAQSLVGLVPVDCEGLAGLELGGIPIVTALSAETGLPAYFVRKVAKSYGTARLCEGGDIGGKHLTVVEDVVTSGGQIVLSAQDLRDAGGVVEDALCVIDRQVGGTAALQDCGITLRSLYSMSELLAS